LDGFSKLSSVGEGVSVSNCGITNLDGLAGLTTIGRFLTIARNPSLSSIDGLAEVTSVAQISFSDNDALTNIDALSGVVSVEDLRIESNNALSNVDGLTNLTSVERALRIRGNDTLHDLVALANLTHIGGDLEISGNNSLMSLDGLASLSSVGNHLIIKNNDALTNLDGLASLTSIDRRLEVQYNSVLAECTVGLGEILAEGGVGGLITISNNAPGCNSIWEAIGGNVDAEGEATPLVTGLATPYPNPTVGAATLTYSLAEPDEVTLTLFDALGRQVRTLAEGPQAAGEHEITLGAGLPAGTYVVRFETDGDAWTERVTVVR
jgi:hypothetical protein